ncbi:MAG: plasmid recombination protein, partial [Eggerthellaceae bacterium]|nr:plasmid recombination protein [Eggerthellaceae bacterium]
MGSGIIRVEKAKASQLGGLQHHHDREGNKHSNQDIDLTRSELNKHWIENGDYEVFVSKRIEE